MTSIAIHYCDAGSNDLLSMHFKSFKKCNECWFFMGIRYVIASFKYLKKTYGNTYRRLLDKLPWSTSQRISSGIDCVVWVETEKGGERCRYREGGERKKGKMTRNTHDSYSIDSIFVLDFAYSKESGKAQACRNQHIRQSKQSPLLIASTLVIHDKIMVYIVLSHLYGANLLLMPDLFWGGL